MIPFTRSLFRIARSSNSRGSHRSLATLHSNLTASLQDSDAEISRIIESETKRQRESLALIPSENFTSRAVLQALGSVMQNKYSEGYPGARYYGGNEFIDQAESLCQQRALEAYRLDPEEWGVNVQSLSGSPANFEVYTAVLEPHDRIMSLDLPSGGHLSHGYQTASKKISAVSKYWDVLPYRLDESTGLIDYDTLEANYKLYHPKLLVTGASAYARKIDYARMRAIADTNKALMLVDMAHISGLVAAGVYDNPFDYADIVTTTTHKTLRGPRGAMIFYRKGVRSVDKKGKETLYDLDEKINFSVFPGHQGGPHNHTITALTVALEQAKSTDFKQYQQDVLDNCQVLAKSLQDKGYNLVSGGTENHLILVDLRDKGINGAKVEKVLDMMNVAVNKNTVPGDKSAMNPGGLRLGTPAMTSRGLNGQDWEKVASFLDAGIKVTLDLQERAGNKKMSDFRKLLETDVPELEELQELRQNVGQFTNQFPLPGVDF